MSARGLKATSSKKAPTPPPIRANGKVNGAVHDDIDQEALLRALQAMQVGDFSVRLPADQTGIAGKIADTFNDIVATNQRMAQQLERVGEVVGKEGKTRQRVKLGHAERRLGRDGRLGQHADRRPALADRGSDPRHRRGGQGRSAADRESGRRWPPAEGRIPALGQHRQHHDQAAQRVHLGSDARGARGRHRRQAGRPGAGERSDRRVEGSDRKRQLDGVQPHRPGAQHRRSDHRGGQWRSVQEDHRRRARRNSAAQGSHQHHGGPAALLRLGSDARGARSRHRRQAGRPGAGAGRRRHLEGSDRLGERDVRQPHRPGAQHRAGDHRRGARRPFAQDHRGRARRNPGAEGHHQHHGGPAQRLRLGSDARGARSGHRRQAGRPGAGARCRRHLEGPDRQRELHGVEPDRPGAQHRRVSPPPSPAATCPRRSPSTCRAKSCS